jgi:hypothetical protein
MPTARQLTVSVPARTFNRGSSDSASLRSAFRSSPIYDGTYSTEEQPRHLFEEPPEFNPADGTINDMGHAFGLVSLGYRDAPNSADIDRTETGGAGKPATAWSPNIASPGEGNGDNPLAIPENREGSLRARGAGGGYGGDGLTSPSSTVTQIVPSVPRRIGDVLTLGRATRI